MSMGCKYCTNVATFRCTLCRKPVCGEHAKLRTVCPSCIRKAMQECSIVKATLDEERTEIRELVQRFWGEDEQWTYDKKFAVTGLPAYIAKSTEKTIGFISFTETRNAILIVALGVLPEYQDLGIGSDLIRRVEKAAKETNKIQLLVSTSNDDLPALAFYQSLGFQILKVKPNAIAEKHGRILTGISGLPIRDELRLRKILD